MIQMLWRLCKRVDRQTHMRAGLFFVTSAMVWMPGDAGTGLMAVSPQAGVQTDSATLRRPATAGKEPWAICLQQAAQTSGVHPALFEAIVKVESGRHPYAFGWYDGSRKWRSYKARTYADAVAHLRTLERQRIRFDIGLAQVSSRNLKALSQRTGFSLVHALNPCANLHLASVILDEQIKLHGRTWKAVAGYNGARAYAQKVYRVYCPRVSETLHCRHHVPLSHLLSYPLPVMPMEMAPPSLSVARTDPIRHAPPTGGLRAG